jgi:hypothetical protein
VQAEFQAWVQAQIDTLLGATAAEAALALTPEEIGFVKDLHARALARAQGPAAVSQPSPSAPKGPRQPKQPRQRQEPEDGMPYQWAGKGVPQPLGNKDLAATLNDMDSEGPVY